MIKKKDATLREIVHQQKQIVQELRGIREIFSSLCGLIDELIVRISK